MRDDLNFENKKINFDDLVYKEEINRQIQEKNDSLMTNEIEDYVDKNMREMHKELEEIKYSFQESIKDAEGKFLIHLKNKN